MDIIYSEEEKGAYFSKYFNYQFATRFVIRLLPGELVEATRYMHYLDGRPIDVVIDLPSMVGCPIRCLFCASSPMRRKLKAEEMAELFLLLITLDDLSVSDFPVSMASFQGTGEPTENCAEVGKACKLILKENNMIRLSISTMGAKLNSIHKFEKMGIKFSSMQFSLSGAIPTYKQRKLIPMKIDALKIIATANQVIFRKYCHYVKLNYLLITNITDTSNHIEWLCENLKGYSGTVKISCLNTTTTNRSKYHDHELWTVP